MAVGVVGRTAPVAAPSSEETTHLSRAVDGAHGLIKSITAVHAVHRAHQSVAVFNVQIKDNRELR